MIKSEKQYTAAKEQLQMLSDSLSASKKEGVPDEIAAAAKAQIKELIDEIKASIEEYEALRDSEDISIHSLDDLMVTPIRYRIAAHMSIDEFGRKVGISARQIARYELEEYQNINASTFQKILKNLDLNLDGKAYLPPQKTTMQLSPPT